MFSERTAFDLRPNDFSLLTAELKRRGGRLIDLTLSNPTRGGFLYPSEPILAAISRPEAMVYEPDPAGQRRAREAVAGLYRERGVEVAVDDILLTSSTSEGYSFLFKLLADPGNPILVPSPSYPLFQYLAKLEGLTALSYPLIYTDEWICDTGELAALAADSAARAVLCVHPNNPTGSYMREMSQLRNDLHQVGVPLICDEVFFDFSLTPTPVTDPALSEDSLVFLLNGLSKTAGLPQLKLSWILIRGPEELKRAARERLELIGDTYLSVNTAVQHALPELLELRKPIQREITGRLRSNLDALREACSQAGLRLLEPEGGWYAVLRLPGWQQDEAFALRLLQDRGVLLHPGSFFGFAGSSFLVVSLLPKPDDFAEGLAALCAEAVKLQ